ncbi:hypothetical protein [Helicobacter kayseriensis]|uniref:hypothetical protein n=1 Tax=Helicobacter kayseriensis TaxID=2905877 RepID=UPI001E3450A7|nr:hypothetical protein [Helicobacter kayseriensis]MCE3047233.1 hypothetical protein [Helicobacter kayseriensis]MCE3048604.1 hypothetical protein [Helicobacter kayseriensis]
MLRSLAKLFYSKVFIGINLDQETCCVNILRTKGGKIKQNIKTKTKLIDNTIAMETLKLIYFFKKKYPLTYIGMMSKTQNQGAIPSIDPQSFIQYELSIQQNLFIPFQTWSAYINKRDCAEIAKQYEDIGPLDSLFSPFVFIFLQARKNEKFALYIIQEKETLSLAICDHQQIHYGKTFHLHDEEMALDSQSNQETISSLDHLLENLDQDIDTLDLDGFKAETEEDEEHQEKAEELNDFVRATHIAQILEETIHHYYQNHKSSFINEIVFLDTYGISPDAFKYIQETLMIDMHIVPFSPSEAVASLMFEEYQRNAL